MQHIFTHLEDCVYSPEGKEVISKLRDFKNGNKVFKSLEEEMAPYRDVTFTTKGGFEKLN